jgi:hypothetical protein
MRLSKRPPIYALPPYSLTGDLLGFLRCGLQYRYTRIGQLPPTQPVQMWFGQFIHGVLEEAYRRYDLARRSGRIDAPPWPRATITDIAELIKRRLAAQGLFPWDETLEKLGDARAEAAINDLGPELFPVIHRAEVRLTGARELPVDKIPGRYRFREADRYEMVGVIDVITHVELRDPSLRENPLVKTILASLPTEPPESFEVIIDYKGMRRPPTTTARGPNFWDVYAWQIRTYAHLRSTHEDSLPVVAGVALFVNELLPTRSDLVLLRREIRNGETDVVPPRGSDAERLLAGWRERDDPPTFPLDFRLARALRVVEVTPPSIGIALKAFDEVVARIETCRGKELRQGRVLSTWETNSTDESTCTACDSRTYCPDYTKESMPRLPGVKARE